MLRLIEIVGGTSHPIELRANSLQVAVETIYIPLSTCERLEAVIYENRLNQIRWIFKSEILILDLDLFTLEWIKIQ
jgi:glutamyl-tRNA reductase